MMSNIILIVTDNVKNQVNGVVTTFNNLEIQARAAGYQVVYLDPGQFPNIACPGYPEVRLCWPHGIGQKIRALAPNYIHIATEGPVGLFARWWCERNHVPYNTSYHTDFAKFFKAMYRVPEFATRWYLRWFHKNSHRVLITTETIRQELTAQGFQRLVIWPRGVDRSIFNSSYRGKKTSGTGPILLSVGRVSREKGLDEFCKLTAPAATKIVIGDGPYRAELEARYPDVHFVGVRGGKDLAWYYAHADVFVFSSRADTFGVVNIEALSCGTPVAAYPVTGPIDIVDPGVTGYLDKDLARAVAQCLTLDRDRVEQASLQWSWPESWRVFEQNLVSAQVSKH
jgi:glycosyltransferase involved in cell wall biosynthesis